MKDNDNMPLYISKPSSDYDLSKCSVIKAYLFPECIEATGMRYKNKIMTLSQMEKEKDFILQNYKDLDIEIEKGLTAGKRLLELENSISKRKEQFKNCGKYKKKSKVKSDNISSIRRSQKKLVLLIQANFSKPVFALCATLTYKVKEYDIKNIHNDFKKLRQKIKYHFPNFAYIVIYEYHADGSLHAHMIYKNAKGLKREKLEQMWQKGYVYIKEFDSKAAPYFCSKNDRLHFYPSGARMYSCSNLKRPTSIQLSPETFTNIVKKSGMGCVSTNARSLIKVENGQEKIVNNYIYKKYQK